MEGRKPRLYVLGEAERRLRQRVEPAEFLSREFEVEGLQVVLELRGLALLSKAFGTRLARLSSAQQSELATLLEKLN